MALDAEILGNKVIIKSTGRVCESAEDLIKSDIFRKALDDYIDKLAKRHSMLLGIFGGEDKSFFERIGGFFEGLKKGDSASDVIKEKRKIDPAMIDVLVDVLEALSRVKASDVKAMIKESDVFIDDSALLMQFVEGFYDHWRRLDRFMLVSNEDESVKPRTVITEAAEKLSNLVRDTYRDIRENLCDVQPRVYRQIRAGVEITAITKEHPEFPLAGIYSKFAKIPVVRNIVLAPPLIINPPMNKRKGDFIKIDKNPAEFFEMKPEAWICYPIKSGEVLMYVFVHKCFMDLGLSLCNLFEIAGDEELSKKPDAVYFYGVPGEGLDGLADSPTVFCEDEKNGILCAGVPGRDEFGYFGYLKKMMLTLHNIVMMKRGRLPFHGAFVKVILKGGKHANVLMIGDTGAGKSETLEAFRTIGEDYIQDIIIIADDMGSIEITDSGDVKAYGTEVGAFLRLDDLTPGYAFGQLDGAIIMSASQTNARIVMPVTTYKDIMKGHEIDYLLYANNYEETGEKTPAIEKFETKEEALEVFRGGKVMSKGTTESTGMVSSYFANIFGPPQYKELHDELAERYFEVFFKKDVFVGQMRTKLGLSGYERKGPEESAKELLETMMKN